MKTFYVNKIDGDTITLTDSEHNHLKNVLRLSVDEQVKVICGDKFNYYCKIKQINKSNTVLAVVKKDENVANPKVKLTAYVSLIKNENLSLITQKLTEIGASTLVPFESRYTVSKDKGTKIDKLVKISQQSLKQCGRSMMLDIKNTQNFNDLKDMFANHDLIIFANEKEDSKSLNTVLNENIKAKDIAFIVGCEGGFTSEEQQFLIDANAQSITLGKRIMRSETACIFLSSVILNFFKEYE